jgi:hypothetical protein
VLLDLHTAPGDLDPKALAAAAADAGLDGVVLTDRNRVDRFDAYAKALKAAGLAAFAGVELLLDRGALVFIPRDPGKAFLAERWSPGTLRWDVDEALERIGKHEGVLIVAHPYQRDIEPMGDRVYSLPNVAGVETRVGRGRPVWDDLADHAADKRLAARIGSCGGDARWLGRAVTVVPGDLAGNADLVDALRGRRCWPVELEDADDPRDRTREAAPPPRAEGEDGERPRRRDDGERGGRDRGERRGPRRDGDRRGGGGGGRKPRR